MTNLGPLWESDEPEKDIPINACVVHDKKTDNYCVFMTTDTSKTAWKIINVYELRPEIEEDFRQMKDLYVGQYFGIFPFLEFLQLYIKCTLEVRRLLDLILAKI